MSKQERAVFNLLWDMVNRIEEDDRSGRANSSKGTIISRYAGMIDDRIANSGYSRSVDSLKLYTTEQLHDEINSRKEV